MSATDELKAAAWIVSTYDLDWVDHAPEGWKGKVTPLDTALEIVSRLEDELTTAYATGGKDALLEKIERLEQFVADTAEGMECLPGCDSTAHAELCPVAYPVEAWRALRRENAELRRENGTLQSEIAAHRIAQKTPDDCSLMLKSGITALDRLIQGLRRENAELQERLAAALDPTWSPEPVKGEGE